MRLAHASRCGVQRRARWFAVACLLVSGSVASNDAVSQDDRSQPMGSQEQNAPLRILLNAQLKAPAGQLPSASTGYQSPLALLLSSARKLIEIRQYDLAYQALNERVDLYAGDVEFDYLLGVAALEHDRPGEAVLALERVLINQPNNLQARAEIARAYLMVKEQDSARREFEAVASQEIPEPVKAIIAQYLDALTRVKNKPKATINAGLTLKLGYDNNVNVASAEDTWLLSDGTRVVPLPQSQPSKSALFGIGADVSIASPINGRLQWITGLHGMLHRYPSQHTLDQEQVDLSTGLAYRNECHQFKMLGQLQSLRINSDAFRNATGVIGQWQCDLSARQQFGGFIQRFELRFPEQKTRDGSRLVVGFSFAQALPVKDGVFLSTIQTGHETSKAGLDNLSFDFKSFRMLLTAPLSTDWRGLLGINWEERRFDGAEPLFGVTRLDRQTELRLGLESEIDKNWTLRPQVVVTRNRSTLAPSDYRRTQAQLVAKYRLH